MPLPLSVFWWHAHSCGVPVEPRADPAVSGGEPDILTLRHSAHCACREGAENYGLVSRKSSAGTRGRRTLMAIRVAHVGTGNVGRLALTELVANPQFELTGVCVSSPEKIGKDAGELTGAGVQTGVEAVGELDAVI